MDTSHSHHLEIHGDTVLSQVKPELKIFTTFCIVFSIAFLSLENNFLIFLQFLIVLYFLYVSKIRIKTYFKRLSIDIPFILFALFLPFISKGDNKILFEIFSVSIYETGFNEMISILIKIT
ncbi:MAG: CbiQ family ECF transporter T component, partial [Candidatus Actinomarina sp.]